MSDLQEHLPLPGPEDNAAFRRVWARVMPEPREDCPFLLRETPSSALPSPALPVPSLPVPEDAEDDGVRESAGRFLRLSAEAAEAESEFFLALARRSARRARALRALPEEQKKTPPSG